MRNKTMFKAVACLLILSMALALLAGCNNGAGPKGNAKEVEYFCMYETGEAQADWLAEMAEAFEKESGIKVNITLAGRSVLTDIQSRILSGNPPDLVDQEFSELTAALMTGSELAMPITDLYYNTPGPEGQAKLVDIFDEALINAYRINGELYFYPYEFSTSGFFYNKTMFAELGLKAPVTWDEFIALNEALKAKGIAPLGQDGAINFYNAYYYVFVCQRVLGTGSFLRAAEDATGATWDDPGYLKAAQLVYELSKSGSNYFQLGYEGSNYPAAQADWAMGKAGSLLCGSWLPLETIEQAADGMVYGFYPVPEVPGGVGKATELEAQLFGMAILKGCKNPDGAKEFLKFISKKEFHEKFVEYTDSMSPRNDVVPGELLADVKAVMDKATAYFHAYDGVQGGQPEWFANVFYPLDNKLLFGDITPEDFIAQIKQETINYWSRKN